MVLGPVIPNEQHRLPFLGGLKRSCSARAEEDSWRSNGQMLTTPRARHPSSGFASSRPTGDRARTAEVAARFDALVGHQVRARRTAGEAAPREVTTRLPHETVDGRALTDEEVVSILRNWTAGDLGSLAACLGVLVHRLATHPDRQDVTRARVARAEHAAIEAAIEQVLRIEDPFVANRRRTTREVQIGGRAIPAGDRVILNWTAANRDPLVFGDPDELRPEDNAQHNLVFGAGPTCVPAGSHTHGVAGRGHRAPHRHRATTSREPIPGT